MGVREDALVLVKKIHDVGQISCGDVQCKACARHREEAIMLVVEHNIAVIDAFKKETQGACEWRYVRDQDEEDCGSWYSSCGKQMYDDGDPTDDTKFCWNCGKPVVIREKERV